MTVKVEKKEKKTLELDGGDVFEGPLDDDGLPDGIGTLQYKSGAKFAGTFEKGELSAGKFTLPEKDTYTGKFADNI